MSEIITTVEIKELLNSIKDDSAHCGFEGFVVMKHEPKLKKLSFDEGNIDRDNNYKNTIKNMIITAIDEKYLAESAEYISGEYIADNQNKFYTIPITEDYSPFSYLDDTITIAFKYEDMDDASGIIFCLRYNGKTVWAYQHLWSIMVPNKKKNHSITRFMNLEDVEILAEQKEPLLTIANKVDLLVVENNIITSNISLMQSNFGFQDYVVATAKVSISKICDKGLVSNQTKLTEYISRGKSKYAKKMMRISNSKVFSLSNEQLLEKIRTVPRWSGQFNIVDDVIELNTYTQVENLIDLFDERYTKSEITDQEYDTDVKQLAEPVNPHQA